MRQDEWVALTAAAAAGDEEAREAVRREAREWARAAAAETSYPDFTESSRPRTDRRLPACASQDCDRPIAADGRADREFCSERCAHRERQRRYRSGLAEKGLWPPSRRVAAG